MARSSRRPSAGRRQATRTVPAWWSRNSAVAVSASRRTPGPWSLFRLLDLMDVDYHSGRGVLILKANLGGLHANYLLHSQRSPNPFDIGLLRSFKLPATL